MKKLLTASNIIACLSFVLSLLFLILYVANFNGSGYFQGVKAPYLVVLAIFVLVFDLLIIARSLLHLEGIVGKVVDIVVYVLKVLIPVFLFIGVMSLTQTRIEGFGYIFFSNVDVAKEVATPANVASAGLSITALVFGGLAALVSIVGAFFLPKEKQAD